MQETGNQGPPEACLTDLEERVLNATGRSAVDGFEVMEVDGMTGMKAPVITQNNIPQLADEAVALEEPQNNINKLLTKDKTPRNRGSLLSTLKDAVMMNKDKEQTLSDRVDRLVKISRKQYKLQKIKFLLKHPDISYNSSSDDEEQE
jgi:hypothetical protein